MADGNIFDTMQDISDAVTRATKTGDFSHLSDTIQDSVADFANSVGDTVAKGAQDFADTISGGRSRERSGDYNYWNHQQNYRTNDKQEYDQQEYDQKDDGWKHTSSGSGRTEGTGRYTAFGNHQTNIHSGDATYESPYRKGNATDETIERIRREKAARNRDGDGKVSYFLQTRPNRNSGVGKRIGGTVGSVALGMLSVFNGIGLGVTAAAASTVGMITAGILLGVTAAGTAWSGYLANKGKKEKELTDQYYKYGKLVGSREYFAIEDLASKAGEAADKVRDNIIKMHQQGLLPHAEMDRNQTTVMLTDKSMQQYAEAEEARQEREREAGAQAAGAAGGNKVNVTPEVQKILDEGNTYIRQIRAINDRIPDTEEMSNKLYRLEDVMKRIFERVQEDPSKAKDIRKLMSYYLPTTMKLLNAYADLCDQPTSGENVTNTKREIEESMDSINDAFEKLLDNLFQDEAWDLSSDLNVMKTMMQQDGLMKDKGKEGKKK